MADDEQYLAKKVPLPVRFSLCLNKDAWVKEEPIKCYRVEKDILAMVESISQGKKQNKTKLRDFLPFISVFIFYSLPPPNFPGRETSGSFRSQRKQMDLERSTNWPSGQARLHVVVRG